MKTISKRLKICVVVIALLIIASAILCLRWNSIIGGKTAFTVNDEKISVSEMQFYYSAAVIDLKNSEYASYYDIDFNESLKNQNMNDSSKYLLGVEEDCSWHDYLMNEAKENLVYIHTINQKATQENFAAEDVSISVESTIESLEEYAVQNNVTISKYLKNTYGKYVTLDVFKKVLEMELVAQDYLTAFMDKIEISDAELETYVEENADQFYVLDYEYIYFKSIENAKFDSQGNLISANNDNTELLAKKAKEVAEEAKERYLAGESLKNIADTVDDCAYYNVVEGVYAGSAVDEWGRASGRKDGDCEVIEVSSLYYLVVFHRCYLKDYNTVDVRHILVPVDTSQLDADASNYNERFDIIENSAKMNAEKILSVWKDNPTEEYFGALADMYSSDSASGGLYEAVEHNQMVEEFDDWIFDNSRKAGDTGIIQTEYGFHIMYFVGENDISWKLQASEGLFNHNYSNYMNSLTENVNVLDMEGLKYVGI